MTPADTPIPASIAADSPPRARRNTGGAPRRNSNAMRHGRYGLILGRLPSGCSYIRQSCAIFRRGLEQAVMAARGSVSLSDAMAIRTATRWERHSLLCARWLHGESADLTPEQRLALSRDIANASERSDRAVKSLALPDRGKLTVWASIHTPLPDATPAPVATPDATGETLATPAASDATAGEPDAQAHDDGAPPIPDVGDVATDTPAPCDGGEREVHSGQPPGVSA